MPLPTALLPTPGGFLGGQEGVDDVRGAFLCRVYPGLFMPVVCVHPCVLWVVYIYG